MVIRALRFNLYFIVLALGLVTGCQTGDKENKPLTTLSVHMEVSKTESVENGPAPVYRAHPILVNVDKHPILTDEDLVDARMVEVPGGFAIRLHFNEHGLIVLNQYSAGNPGKHYAVEAEFGAKKYKQKRWLAAPLMPRNFPNASLTFTPDADRDETTEIVTGLTNTIAAKPSY